MPIASEYQAQSRKVARDRLAAVRFVAEHGPISGADAADRLGWSLERWWDAICIGTVRLMTIEGKGFVVTQRGREWLKKKAALPQK